MALCKDEFGRDICDFVLNEDGTVSGIVAITLTGGTGDASEFVDGLVVVPPSLIDSAVPLTPECCSQLGFTYSTDDNLCYWSESCDIIDEFKIVVNPKGNDGAIFDVDENESCILEVEFDYLIEYDCADLLNCKFDNQEDNGTDVSDILIQIEEKENSINELTAITSDLQVQKEALEASQAAEIADLENQVATKQSEFTDVQTQLNTVQAQIAAIIAGGGTPPIILINLENALIVQLDICFAELQDLTSQLEDLINDTTLADLIKECDALTIQINNCQIVLADLQQQLDDIINQQTTGSVETITGMLEGLDVCVTIDKVVPRTPNPDIIYEDPFTLETIFEESLFKIEDLVEYLRGNKQTGLLFNGSNCQVAINCILAELSANCDVVSGTSFNSDWLHHKIVISDEETLSAITNEKIKISLKVKDCKCDFSILMDRIEMNKRCTTVDREDVFVSRCPSFELMRLCDNKKSWLAIDDTAQREFDLSLRLTDYTPNHHKLVINSKEVDLSISPATAVENDVWCYMIDNPCILTACTEDTLCTGSTCTATTTSATTALTDACFSVSMVKPESTQDVTVTLSGHGLVSGDIFTISGSVGDFNTELTGFGIVSGVTDVNNFKFLHDLTHVGVAPLSGTGIIKKYEQTRLETGLEISKSFIDSNGLVSVISGITGNEVVCVNVTDLPSTGFTNEDFRPYRTDSSANPYQLGYAVPSAITFASFSFPTSASTGLPVIATGDTQIFTVVQSASTTIVEVATGCVDCGGNSIPCVEEVITITGSTPAFVDDVELFKAPLSNLGTVTYPNHGLTTGDVITISGSSGSFNTSLVGFSRVETNTDDTFRYRTNLTSPSITAASTGDLVIYQPVSATTGVTLTKSAFTAVINVSLTGVPSNCVVEITDIVPVGSSDELRPIRLDFNAVQFHSGFGMPATQTSSGFTLDTAILGLTGDSGVGTVTVYCPVDGVSAVTATTTCCADINDVLTTPLSAITTVKEFEEVLCTELVDAKSRKTITKYPLLKELYHRYLNGEEVCGVKSSGFDYFSMAEFADLIGDYWVDLVEQVIPATTIWGATYTYKNTVFDKEKFKYRKYTTFICNEPNTIPLDTIASDTSVNVVYQDLSKPENIVPECLGGTGNTETCDGVFMLQIDDGSEFIGSVSIIANPDDGGGAGGGGSMSGDTGNTDDGDIIIVNENPDVSVRN